MGEILATILSVWFILMILLPITCIILKLCYNILNQDWFNLIKE